MPATRKTKPAVRRSNADVYEAVLDTKNMVIDLKQHVNDRNDVIERTLKAHGDAIMVLSTKKADKTQLLTSIGFKFLAKPTARWAIGVIAAGILATTITGSHWLPDVQGWLDAILS